MYVYMYICSISFFVYFIHETAPKINHDSGGLTYTCAAVC